MDLQDQSRKVNQIKLPLVLTRHAQERMQQLGIPQEIVLLLLDWGYHDPIGGNKERVIFRKRELNSLREHLSSSQWQTLEQRKRIFAVLGSDGAVVTMGHRDRHLRRL